MVITRTPPSIQRGLIGKEQTSIQHKIQRDITEVAANTSLKKTRNDESGFDLDYMLRDYDAILKDATRDSNLRHHKTHCHHCNSQQDKDGYMNELSRYRRLYVEMMELLKVTKKTFEQRAHSFASKEKMFGEKLRKKMEAKELELAKDLDRQQADINRLTLQLRDIKRTREDSMKQRDTALEDRKRIQHEMYIALDSKQAFEVRVRELEGGAHDYEQEKITSLQLVKSLDVEMKRKDASIAQSLTRIRQLETATNEIMKAQLMKSSMDQGSILRSNDELRITTQNLEKTQAQLKLTQESNTDNEQQVEKVNTIMQAQVKQINSQKETIEALSGLVQRLSQRQSESMKKSMDSLPLEAIPS